MELLHDWGFYTLNPMASYGEYFLRSLFTGGNKLVFGVLVGDFREVRSCFSKLDSMRVPLCIHDTDMPSSQFRT